MKERQIAPQRGNTQTIANVSSTGRLLKLLIYFLKRAQGGIIVIISLYFFMVIKYIFLEVQEDSLTIWM